MSAVIKLTAARIRKDVERAAELATLIKGLEAELESIKGSFRALGDGEYLGRGHKVTVKTVSTSRLDTTEVKARLTPAQYVECVVITESTRVLIKEI